MKQIVTGLLLIFLLAACNSDSSSSSMDAQLMDDNAELVKIVSKTQISSLKDEDRVFLDGFLENHFTNTEAFNAYNEKEQELVLEAVKAIEKLKEK